MAEEYTPTAARLLERAWDDGNASGLDGWVGPGRGAGEVDAEAERGRAREVARGAADLEVLFARRDERIRAEERVREREMLDRIWSAFGCAVHPDSYRPEVRAAIWDQIEEMARDRHARASRIARELTAAEQALADERAKRPDREQVARTLFLVDNPDCPPDRIQESTLWATLRDDYLRSTDAVLALEAAREVEQRG